MEGQVPKLYCSDAVEIKGARRLLASLQSLGAPWAIVTSGTSDLASGWLAVLGLPQPSALVTAEAVASGKPDPEGYLAARAQVLRGRELRGERRALVLEDAPAGIAAGVAAGCDVVALATSHGVAELRDTRARWVVRDLESVRVVGYDAESGDVQVEVRNWIERREAN
jgi:glycerol 3-phosphatase-1